LFTLLCADPFSCPTLLPRVKKKKSGASRPSYNARRAKGVWKEQGREKTHQKVENYFKRGVPHRKLRCSLSCVLIRFPVLHCCRV
jgi:hypothetical protein